MYNPYIGRDSQLFGVEEHRLVGGRGDGMRIYEITTGGGLNMTVEADRCLDISRISYKGVNLSYFSCSGYVAPAYYDKKADGFLDSFTGGFLTTCGLTHFGSPSVDDGEECGLHGPINGTPADDTAAYIDGDNIVIRGSVYQARQFTHKLRMDRVIKAPIGGSGFSLRDRITNFGDTTAPLMVLYHINFGYPLLSEDAKILVNSARVEPRSPHAAKDIDTWNRVIPPQNNFEEQCYFHFFDEKRATAAVENEKLNIRAQVGFDIGDLKQLTQWKMMGVRDYVMGLEPGTNDPDGRASNRERGLLRFIAPGETVEIGFDFTAEDIR